jgi:hypothetical protein
MQPEPGPGQPAYGQQPPAPQPSYGQQPQYGQQPGYGQQPPQMPPPMGPVTTQFARLDPGPSQKFGITSFVLTLIGTVLTVLSFTAVNWFDGPASSKFSRIHQVINAAVANGIGSPPIARAYFSWLGWVLLAAAIVVALLAATPAIGGPFRIAGVVVAVAAVALTFVAIKVFKDAAVLNTEFRSYGSYLKHARRGFYLAVTGFVLIGIGAALGPSRER